MPKFRNASAESAFKAAAVPNSRKAHRNGRLDEFGAMCFSRFRQASSSRLASILSSADSIKARACVSDNLPSLTSIASSSNPERKGRLDLNIVPGLLFDHYRARAVYLRS